MSESKGKILIIVENLPVPFDTRVWQEATTLKKNGYTVSVICPKGKNYNLDEEVLEGVNIFRHDLTEAKGGGMAYFKEYSSALREELRLAKLVHERVGFDVIHGCNPPDDIYMVARRFKKYGVRYVFDHHDICPELYEAKFGSTKGLMYRCMLWLEKQTYKHCTFAFVTNESYRDIAINRCGMDPERVIVLRSGPRLERMRVTPPDESLKNGHRFMVGYLGVIGKQEGIDYLLEAAHILKERGADVQWGVVGGGPYLDTARAHAREMGLDDCVTFTGRVDDDTMLSFLNTADVCVNCDEYNAMNNKSTMNKIMEYMALSKPIVQFDLTEGRFSAQDASLYAKRNDARDMADLVFALLNDPERRKEMGKYGRERVVNELSWEHTSKALLEGYEKFFSGAFN